MLATMKLFERIIMGALIVLMIFEGGVRVYD